MDEYTAWQNFLNTGSVIDYLTYKAIINAKENAMDTSLKGDSYDIQYRWSDFNGAECGRK